MAIGLSLAATFAAPSVARAQHNDDVARAESLFNAAKALLDAGQNADACAKFAESKRLAPGLGVTLYLADCYERIGRTASAWTEFRSAEGLARERNDKRAEVARGRAQTLEPRLDRLTITVAPTVPQAGLQILRDGAVVSAEEWGLAVPVDPGDHVVVVSSPGHPQRTIAAHVGPESADVDGEDRSPRRRARPGDGVRAGDGTRSASASAPASAPASASHSSAPSDPGATRRWIGIGVGGAGVVGVVLGAVFGLSAKSKLSQSNDGHCDAQDTCDLAGLSLRHDASIAATVSTIAFVAGGVAIAGGVVLYLTAPRSTTGVGLTVALTPGGALLRGTFWAIIESGVPAAGAAGASQRRPVPCERTVALEAEPGAGRDRLRTVADLEVQHGARSIVADRADAFAGADVLPDLDVDLVEVPAHRVVVRAVIEDDDAAVRPVAVRERDVPGECGSHRGARGRVDLGVRGRRFLRGARGERRRDRRPEKRVFRALRRSRRPVRRGRGRRFRR